MDEAVVADGLTLADWILAGSVLVGGIVVGRIVRAVLSRRIPDDDVGNRTAELVARLVGYLAILGGAVYALATLDVKLGPLLGALGIGGLALAFAAQSILANLIASVILQMRRPFRRGDQIETNGQEGTVEEVNFRTVNLRTFDGERVLVPCAEVLGKPIVNFTQRGRRRTTLPVGIAYTSDLEKVQWLLLDTLRRVEGVLETPAPEVWVEAFGESSIDLSVRFWHRPDIATLWRVRSAVAVAVKGALDDAGVTIPFPQRVVWSAEPPR